MGEKVYNWDTQKRGHKIMETKINAVEKRNKLLVKSKYVYTLEYDSCVYNTIFGIDSKYMGHYSQSGIGTVALEI